MNEFCVNFIDFVFNFFENFVKKCTINSVRQRASNESFFYAQNFPFLSKVYKSSLIFNKQMVELISMLHCCTSTNLQKILLIRTMDKLNWRKYSQIFPAFT